MEGVVNLENKRSDMFDDHNTNWTNGIWNSRAGLRDMVTTREIGKATSPWDRRLLVYLLSVSHSWVEASTLVQKISKSFQGHPIAPNC